jgi:2-C-methyl-D-erythritol 4-phosphate cytidylyltransferase
LKKIAFQSVKFHFVSSFFYNFFFPFLDWFSTAPVAGALLHGGILAMPVADTLKQVAEDTSSIQSTISREGLWQAQTPQMFRLADLHTALERAVADRAAVTDEASAVERLGGKPILIKGSTRNFKVTHQADWELMELVLAKSDA